MATDAQVRAEQANQVLANPVFMEAYNNVIDGILETQAMLAFDDAEGRLASTYMMSAAAMFKEELTSAIGAAQIEKAERAGEEKK